MALTPGSILNNFTAVPQAPTTTRPGLNIQTGPTAAGINSPYTYSYNGTGGVNYYKNTVPITNTVYGAATGLDTNGIESAAAQSYASQHQAAGGGGGGRTTTTGTGGGGGGGGTTTNNSAQQAGELQYLNDQLVGATASGNQSGSVAGSTYNDQGSTLASQLRQKQSGIDSARKSIAMDQINSIRGLSDSINQGLKSGAVSLGNSNALDSSAANAIGRIYANYGNTQRNVINNGAAVKNDTQDVAQNNLNLDRTVGLNSLNTYKNTVLDQISNDTQSKLAAIDGIASLQGLGGKLNVQGIKEAVIANAQQKLADADKYVQGLLSGVTPMNSQDIATKAYALSNAGVQSSTGGLSFTPANGAVTPQQALGGASNVQVPLTVVKKTDGTT